MKKNILIFLTLIFLGAGLYIRLINLSNFGYYFDTIQTQFTWGRGVNAMGLINFWQNYKPYFDYPFWALAYDALLFQVSRILGGTDVAFISVVKSVDLVLDLTFSLFIAYLLRNKFQVEKITSYLLASLLFVLPITWYVSGVWGQFDIILILGSFWSCYRLLTLLFSSDSSATKQSLVKPIKIWIYEFDSQYLLAVFIFCFCFWIKTNIVFILLPFTILLFVISKFEFKKFIFSFSVLSFLLEIIPFVLNIPKFFLNTFPLFGSSKHISNGGDVLWTIFTTDENFLTLFRILGILFLLTTIYFLYNKLTKIQIDKINIYKIFLIVLSIFSLAYFLFSTSMHSRYSYIGVIFVTILMFIDFIKTSSKNVRVFLIFMIFLISFAFLNNNASVYGAQGYMPNYQLFQNLWKGSYNSIIFLIALGYAIYTFWKIPNLENNK